MLSDVEVGAFLSGGVDSGYLASSSGAEWHLQWDSIRRPI